MEKLPNPSHESLFRSNFWNERNIQPIFSQPFFRHISICMIEANSLISDRKLNASSSVSNCDFLKIPSYLYDDLKIPNISDVL